MPLVIAIKNQDAIVVACDTDNTSFDSEYSEMTVMANRSVLLIAGNTEGVRTAITKVFPQVTASMSAAALAQLVQASLVLEVVPHLANLKGRAEIVVAGFDPLRHGQAPGLYYMDSAQDFYLKIIEGDAVVGGATAAVTSLLAGHDFSDANSAHLKVLAKECISATKLRWPGAVKSHINLGVVTTASIQVQTL
jgi:20S proteasome alpha/beta subunit